MAGAYRLVIKGHDGLQIGVLTAYESLTYEKLQNRVGEAVLVANYGVTDATDALLDELAQDILLEVQRHPDPTDASLDWYVDWIGFCEPPEEGITPVNTQRKVWRFRHANRLLEQNQVQPPLDGCTPYGGQRYALNRELFTGSPGNIMRRLVRRHCTNPQDASRIIQALYVQDDEDTPADPGGWPGWVFREVLDPTVEAVTCSHVWQGELAIGLDDTTGLYEIQRSTDGETWTNELNVYTPWCMATFDDTGGERLYFGYGNYGWSPYYSGIQRSAVGAYGGWGAAWTAEPIIPHKYIQLVCALTEHNGRLYAGTGWGSYLDAGSYVALGQIWRCLANDGTSWSQVHDGNPGGTGVIPDKHNAVEALISWNGHIYAGVSYYYGTRYYGQWEGGKQNRGAILRSASGDIGSWETVKNIYGSWMIDDSSTGDVTVVTRGPVDGVCCFAEFGSHLYAGVGDRIFPHARDGRIYRTSDGTTWEQVFGGGVGDVADAINETRETPQYSAPGVTWLHVHSGVLFAGCGGPKPGDGEVWYTTDGTTWIYAFDQRGYEAFTCHSLTSFKGDLYATFGVSPVGPGNYRAIGYGYIWRMTDDGWDPPDWTQESGGNWVSVLSVLQGVADSTLDTEGGTDFAVVPTDLGGALQEFVFEARTPWGEDRRSTGADPTIFGINRGNMANPIYKKLKGNRPTNVYALGVGQGDDRSVLEMKDAEGATGSPWGRWEATVNIQGVDTSGELWQQAAKVREGDGPSTQFTFDILETPSTRYGVEWDVGYLVTAVHNGRTLHCKILGTTVRLGSNPAVEEIDTEILLLEEA